MSHEGKLRHFGVGRQFFPRQASTHGAGEVSVGENSVDTEWMGAGQGEFVEELTAKGWLSYRGSDPQSS